MPPVLTSDNGACTLVQSSLLDGIPHGISTRHGGVSAGPYRSLNLGLSTADSEGNVRENRRRFFQSLGIRQDAVVAARLVHGRDVAPFHRDKGEDNQGGDASRPSNPGVRRDFHADGVVSDVPGAAYFMTFADCVPLLFADPGRGVIGAAHAGWRGTALGVAAEVVSVMHREFNCQPSDILVAIGPSIGPCCYEVSDDVPAHFESRGTEPVLIPGHHQRMHLDLWETNRLQLLSAGVQPTNIDRLDVCTSCHSTDFFSHRRENGTTGRFGLCIGLDEKE